MTDDTNQSATTADPNSRAPTEDEIRDALFLLRDAGFLWNRSMKGMRPVEDYRRGLGATTAYGLKRATERLILGEIGDQSGFIPIPSKYAELAIQEARNAEI